MGEPDAQVKLGFVYLCNELSKDPYDSFKLMVLSTLMFEGPNSPFYKKIIEEGVAPSYCPGYGYDYTTRESTFTLGVQGIKLEEIKKCERALEETLVDIAKNGIEKKFLETELHRIEFQNRMTRSHFGLMFISHMLPYVIHGGNSLAAFQMNEFSERLRKEYDDEPVFQELVKKFLLNNEYKVKLLMVPDETITEKEEQDVKNRLKKLSQVLSEEEK